MVKVLAVSLLVAGAASGAEPPATGITASSLRVDSSVNPCEDFYRYACGPWIAENPIPADRPRWGRFAELAERNQQTLRGLLEKASTETKRDDLDRLLGDFYGACMDETVVEGLGSQPIQPDLGVIAALKSKSELPALLAHLRGIGVNAFARLTSGPDVKDTKAVIAQLDQGGLALPDRDTYLKDDAHAVEIRRKYRAHIEKTLGLLGDGSEAAQAAATTILEIETTLAKASQDPVTRRKPEATYNKMSLADLQRLSPGFSWAAYFKASGAPEFQSLNVVAPDFIRGMGGVIEKESLPSLQTYLRWHAVDDRTGLLSKAFVNEGFDFHGRALTGAPELSPRWKRCVQSTDTNLGDALGQRFVEATFGPDGKERTSRMVAALEKALATDISDLEWMTPTTKARALEKLRAITNKIGYPNKWIDYSTLRVDRRDHAGNIARATAHESTRVLRQIGTPTDKGEWDMTPPTVNADYIPEHNDINFPAGILQPPFFDKNRDEAVNFGAIGAVIGHELTHGFDDEGRQYGPDGSLSDWWTDKDAKEFEHRAQCIVDEYSRLVAVDDIHVKGDLTLGENTADHGGLRVALMALHASGTGGGTKEGLTEDQRFFVGWSQIWCESRRDEFSRLRAATDPHAPPKLRVIVPLSDMPEFQKAFSCPADAPMVKKDRCQVW